MKIFLISFTFILLKTDNISHSFEEIEEVLKCYKCDSLTNECTEDIPGEVVDCPASIGCAITYEEEEGKVTMARDNCSRVMRFDISVAFMCVLTIRLCFIPIPSI